jgi:type IV fimbrial biogenesis protein FimT
MNTRQQRGFTLWELLMTLLVAGILLGIGVPNVMEFQRNGAMSSAANDLVTGVLLARTEAVKRQVPVTLCLSADPDAVTPTCSAERCQLARSYSSTARLYNA